MAATHLRPAAVRKRVLNRGLTANQSGSDCRLHQARGGRELGPYRRRCGQDQLCAEPPDAGDLVETLDRRKRLSGSHGVVDDDLAWPAAGRARVGVAAVAATSIRTLSWSSIRVVRVRSTR